MAVNLVYDINDKPPFGRLIVLALQQLLAIMAATIAVPVAIGLPTQVPSAILGAGVGTLVYLLFTRFKSPVFLGSSFAFISSLISATAFGYLGILVGAAFAGMVYVIIAIVIHFAGTKWVSKLMPPVVIGPTVALIGLSLAGSAVTSITTAAGDTVNGAYNLVALFCGLVTFFTVVICSGQKRFKTMKLIPFIIGIGAGYVVAAIFTAFGLGFDVDYLKIVDFIKEIITGEARTGVEGAVLLNGQGVAEVALAFIPVALVVFAEHIADHKNLGSIIGRDLVEGEPGLKRTLLGDGVGSIAGTILGICPNTTYGESVGCVAITGNASVRTIFVTAIMCVVLSFLSPIMALLQTIPAAVMGGVCFTLYGFIAVSGLKMFKDIDLGENKNLFVVSAILIAGIGGLAIQIPYHLADNGLVDKAVTVTSIATALILGIITYAVMNKIEKGKLGQGEEEASVPSAAVENSVEPKLNHGEDAEDAANAVEDADTAGSASADANAADTPAEEAETEEE